MKKERKQLPLDSIELNTGQLPWLPKNPRTWTQSDIDRTATSIREDTDFLEDRPLLVTPCGEKFVAFAGNLRHEGAAAAKLASVPAVIYFPETDEDFATVKRRAMKDNGSFGAWDWDELANSWDDLPLTDWGVPAWPEGEGQAENDKGGGIEIEGLKEKGDEEVEAYLNEAMRENVAESLAQMEHGLERGWLVTFLTRGLAQAKFIRAKFYGEHYPQWMSLYFCPERIKTSASKLSPWEQMTMIARGETDAGIAGLRTVSGDHLLLLLKGSYPFGGARMPMDFPANKARELIAEFCENQGRGAAILDPYHGWGGRLTGALMADAGLYVGVDPSSEAHAGVEKMADAFLPYCKESRAEFILSPFEDADLGGRTFDFAITSPPYFDVEQYHGDGQSHVRYPKYDKWREGFYRPLIERVFAALKPGSVFCLQVGSQSYPLLNDGKALAIAAGFVVEDVRPLGGGTSSALHNNDDETEENEKIIILRKPADK